MQVNIKRILCPVDFSPNSEHALLYALAFAQAQHAELELLHVIEFPLYTGYDFPTPVDAMEKATAATKQHLEAVAADLSKQHTPVRWYVETGFVFLKIIEVARTHDIDLIVMGTHGRTALAHVLMGSVAEKVVRKAPCPVLTVKHPEHEFVMPCPRSAALPP